MVNLKKRLRKKLKKEEIIKTLSLHWQRKINNEKAFELIEAELIDYKNLEALPNKIKERIKTRLRNAIEEMLQKNLELNSRYIKRVKLFSIEELMEDAANENENLNHLSIS
mgnify:FL=1